MIIWILISFSFSVHLFLHRPRTQNSRIIGQYTHNLLGLKTLSFSVLLFIHKNMDKRSPNWVRHAKCTWSSFCRSQFPMLGKDIEKDLLSFISKPSTKCSFFRCRELKATYPCVPHLQHKRSQNVHWLKHFIISRSSTTFELFSVLERKRTFTQPGAFFKKQLGSSVEKEL